MEHKQNRYCWLRMPQGEFSESWTEPDPFKLYTEQQLKEASERGWKLIKFECANDPDFVFTKNMKFR